MRPGKERREGQGGVPDGLLVGVLAFLLGVTLMVWTATGLAGWFSRGTWPDGLHFSSTPMAMRHLLTDPHDLAGAWPDATTDQLSGYGLFWGLFISELMVLFVLAVFAIGTVARWKEVRARRRTTASSAPSAHPGGPEHRATEALPPTPASAPGPAPTPVEQTTAGLRTVRNTGPAEVHSERVGVRPEPAVAGIVPGLLGAGAEQTGTTASPTATWTRPSVVLGPPDTRRPLAAQAVRDAEGPALIVTSDPALWSETKDARAKLGPVLLYDPAHLCDTPARLHWSPSSGCEDRATAAARATALLAPVRPTARIDQAVADVAETLLRSYLHAAAVEGRTIRHIHRWAQGSQVQDAIRALRTNPKAASGAAGELEAALTSHPERRDMAQELTGRALSSLSTVHIREACTPNRNDSLTLDSFVNEGGTLYVVGESLEDPRQHPGAMPLLTALASSVVERGRRMAERSSSGRLDPPLALVLDDVAAVAPLPQLPELLSSGTDRGLPTLALLRSREQGRARWPQYELPV
ncbi:type IV secretory system conjugative DNA transfer family protein [Streptomyces sp. SID2888]|uniref:type IV secretory system conjugative DNA transfer family protein n=1 Tax=Streptomyces sp. SID2888 TaxID=2690256 RepID=UPI0013705FE6|nr:type IV secretory system conjugative DNA transfer family protein [Streptomyces sp. SID2888]MYV46914.1 type VI secretion protein [Streptomyces sp. SID2888]